MQEASAGRQSILGVLTGLLLAACLLLGGGTRQGSVAEAALQLLALASLMILLLHPVAWQLDRLRRACVLWVTAVCLLVLVQLLPLPLEVWTTLPGRSALAADLELAGVMPGWHPISVDPQATLRAGLALLPPIAVFLLAMHLSLQQQIRLLQVVILVALGSCVFGFAQLADGPNSALRWHEHTSTTNAVGSFANRNHLAALLAISLPLTAAWLMVGYEQQSADRRAALSLVACAISVLLLVGLAVTRSRAGVLLGLVGTVGIAWMAFRLRRQVDRRDRRHRRLHRWLALAAVVAVAVSLQFGLVELLGRLRSDPLEDRRWTIAATTVDAIKSYGWTGSGLGTFLTVYPSQEPVEQRNEYYVNRAHNDWLEWLLEGGLPLLIVILVGLGLLVRLSASMLAGTSRRAPWRWASLLGILMLLLHSVIDYPMRTTALASLMALLVACLLPEQAPEIPKRIVTVRTRVRKPKATASEAPPADTVVPNEIPEVSDAPWLPLDGVDPPALRPGGSPRPPDSTDHDRNNSW